MKLLRHHLCYLPSNHRPLSQHTQEELDYFHYWQKQAYPLVCTRQPQGLDDANIQLAIPYYNSVLQQKIRLHFLLSGAGFHIQTLPSLNDIFHDFDTRWRMIGVYGSFCWQYITGEPYVHSNSDLDILIPYLNQTMDNLNAIVQEIKLRSKLPVDGEVRFPTFGDCAICELLNDTSQTILFKSTHAVELVPREIIYANFPALVY